MSVPTMTKIDLLLLGLLLDRPMHGYEMYQQIQAEGVDDWFNVSTAGVYYSLRKLHEQGLVVESRQRKGGNTRKSIYRLTETGRAAFFTAMERELASQDEVYLDYDLAIYLLNKLPLRRAIPPLEQRRDFLAEQVERVQATLEVERGNGTSLRLAILDHKRRFLEMERDWLEDVIGSVRAESEGDDAGEGERRGLMILDGSLGDFHLPDLLHLILSGQHSGTLRVTDGADVRILVFENGQPAYASYTRQGESPTSASSCEVVMEGLCELFRWQEGRFTFDQRIEHQDWYVPLECSAEQFILRGCRKVDDWAMIQQLVSSADMIFELGPVAQRLERLGPTPVEEQVVSAVDGVKNVAAIARELDLTLFETSRVLYCLTAIGVLHTATLDKILLRRVFREIAELICNSTLAWRPSPDDRSCEEEVNQRTTHLSISLHNGRVEDKVGPHLGMDELREVYVRFLREQLGVVGRRFGRANADRSFEQALHHLSPDLQDVATRYGFVRLAKN